MANIIRKVSYETVKAVIDRNFTFSDLSPRFEGVDSSTGNIFCPFHENHSSPAAKMYWDSEREIWVLHCFGQCHRNFTAYDYVDLILCDRYQKYHSPLDFLKKNMPSNELALQLNVFEKKHEEIAESIRVAKEEYINAVAAENDTIEDFIEALYTA